MGIVGLGMAELMALTYKLGCDIDVTDVEATERFNELLASFANHAQPNTAAHVQLLGESLITAAADSLPRSLKTHAKHWRRYDPYRQLEVLREVGRTLRSYQWYKVRDRKVNYGHEQVYQDALPKQFGRWRTGPVIPSCLGMATMLAGFAATAGAPHWVALVLRPRYYEIYALDTQFRSQTIKYLEQKIPVFAKQTRLGGMRSELREIKEALAEIADYSFHPALIVQLSDGQWVLLDVYFEAIMALERDQQAVEAVVEKLSTAPPHAVANLQISVLAEPIARWNREWDALTRVTDRLLARLGEQAFSGSSLCSAATTFKRNCRAGGALEFLSTDVGKLTTAELVEKGLRVEPSSESADDLWARLDQEPEFAEFIVGRLVHFVFRQWYQRVSDEQDNLALQMPHPALEIQSAATRIAVGVLNNVRCFYDEPVDIGAELVRYSDSQAMWYNSHLYAHVGMQAPDVEDRLRQREEALRATSPNLLHPRVMQLLAACDQQGGLHA